MATASRNFSVLHEKIIHCRVVSMCPTMDLVASLHADGQLSVHRTMGWQRNFTLTLEDMGNRTFSCITWSPDGKTLAVGYTDGTIQLFGVETGAEECWLTFHGGRSLAALTWVAQQPRQGAARSKADEEVDYLAEVAAAYADRCEHLLGLSDRLPGGSGSSSTGIGGHSSDYGSQAEDGFALLQGMRDRPVSILASADASGLVVLSICGAYRLVTIDLKSHRGGGLKGRGRGSVGARHPYPIDSPRQRRSRRTVGVGGGSGAGTMVGSGSGASSEADDDGAGAVVRPLQLTLSSDLSLLSALVEADGHIELVQVDLPLLWSRRHELKPLAMQFTAFGALIGRLHSCAKRLPSVWSSAVETLENKLGSLEECLAKHGYDKSITPRDEIIHLVTCGHASDALTQFLSTSLTEAQLTRMRKTVDNGVGQVESMLRGDISFLARTLLFRASDLQRLAVGCNGDGSLEDDSELGLSPAPVQAFLKDCEMLCVKVEHALREVQVCRSRLRFLLAWLEQMSPFVTDAAVSDGADDQQREFPSLSLGSSILSFLREPLPTDQVESIIGASVPSILAYDDADDVTSTPSIGERQLGPAALGTDGASAVLPGGGSLWSRTVRGQVERLQASVGDLFRAPRNRLTQAVGKPACARICPSPETAASDPVRTRAAARAAAAAAAGSVPPLVPMRACTCFRDRLPSGCGDLGHSPGGSGGVVVATVSPDTSRGKKGLDVIWIVILPMSRGTRMQNVREPEDENENGDQRSVYVAGVRPPPGFHVRQIDFYESVPGVPTRNEASLAMVLEPMGDKDEASMLHLLALDNLNFTDVGPFIAFNTDRLLSPTRKGRAVGLKDVTNVARGYVETLVLSELSSRSRALPKHIKGVTVALSGARGMACVVSTSKHMIVFDMVEDEEDDDEEDLDEEDDEGN